MSALEHWLAPALELWRWAPALERWRWGLALELPRWAPDLELRRWAPALELWRWGLAPVLVLVLSGLRVLPTGGGARGGPVCGR